MEAVGDPIVLGAAVAADEDVLTGQRRLSGDVGGGDTGDGLGELGHDQVAVAARHQPLDLRDEAVRTGQVRAAHGDGGLRLRSPGGDLQALSGILGKAAGGGDQPLLVDQRCGAAAGAADVQFGRERVGAVLGDGADHGTGRGGGQQAAGSGEGEEPRDENCARTSGRHVRVVPVCMASANTGYGNIPYPGVGRCGRPVSR